MRLICDTAASCACKIGRSASPATGAGPGATTSARGDHLCERRTGPRRAWRSELPFGCLRIVPQVVRQLAGAQSHQPISQYFESRNGRYATVRSSSSPFSSSVRSSRLSSLCPSTVPCHRRRVVFEDVRAGIVATLRRHRNDDRDELSAHEWLYQERRVHHDVSIEDYGDLCRSHWAGFAKFTKWMHHTHTL